jgi:hypothetical protein
MEVFKMEDFKKQLMEQLQLLTKDEDCKVVCQRIVKPNDSICEAVNLCYPDVPLCANYYVEHFYQYYLQGRSVEELAEFILECNKNWDSRADVTETRNLIEALSIYDFIKDKLAVRLYSLASNREYLQDTFFVPFLETEDGYEFAVCFYAVLERGEDGIGSIPIPVKIREKWVDVTDEQILENTLRYQQEHFPTVRMTLEQICPQELKIPEGREDGFARFMNPPEKPLMYVATNEKQVNGATVLLYKDYLKQQAEELDSDLYILPSSIHEVIIVPVSSIPDIEKELDEMIQIVNRENVKPTEVLSEHLLYYSRATDSLSVWREKND